MLNMQHIIYHYTFQDQSLPNIHRLIKTIQNETLNKANIYTQFTKYIEFDSTISSSTISTMTTTDLNINTIQSNSIFLHLVQGPSATATFNQSIQYDWNNNVISIINKLNYPKHRKILILSRKKVDKKFKTAIRIIPPNHIKILLRKLKVIAVLELDYHILDGYEKSKNNKSTYLEIVKYLLNEK